MKKFSGNKIFVLCTLAALTVLPACSGDVKDKLGLRTDGPDEFAVERKPKLDVPPSFKLRPPAPGEDPLHVSSPRDNARKALIGDGSDATAAAETKADDVKVDDKNSTLKPSDFKLDEIKIDGSPAADAAAKPAPTMAIDAPSLDAAPAAEAPKAEIKPQEPTPSITAGESVLLKNAGADAKDNDIRQTLRKEYQEEQDPGVLDKLQNISGDNFDKTVVDPAAEKERISENKAANKPITEGETPAKSINNDKSFFEKIFN